MEIIAVLVVSFVALFSFATAPFSQGRWVGQGFGQRSWPASSQNNDIYRPQRKAVLSNVDGYAHRTADGTQMTRRDRGREYWEPNSERLIDNQRSIRGWISRQFNLPESSHALSSASRSSVAITNFNPKKIEPALRILPTVLEYDQTLPPAPPEMVTVSPASVVISPAPLYQNQVEMVSLPPAIAEKGPELPRMVSLGRKINTIFQADPNLTKAFKLTLRVSNVDGKVTLKGLVPSEKEKIRLGNAAQEIAGPGIDIENSLWALLPETGS